jgi:large repetitive protein
MKRVIFTGLLLAMALVLAAPVAAMADTTTISFQVGSPPTVTNVSANNGDAGTAPSVTITGTEFVVGQAATVAISGTKVTASSVTVTSNTTITATFTIESDAAAGARDVRVSQLGQDSAWATGAFTVNAFITVNSPDTIDLGYLTAGLTKTGSVALTGLVATNAATWSVEVKDQANGGFLKAGSTALGTGKFQIDKAAGPYVDSDTGFSYTQLDGVSPTLYYSQAVPASPTAGSYSIVLTFTGSTN